MPEYLAPKLIAQSRLSLLISDKEDRENHVQGSTNFPFIVAQAYERHKLHRKLFVTQKTTKGRNYFA